MELTIGAFNELNEQEYSNLEGGDWLDVLVTLAGGLVGTVVATAVFGPIGGVLAGKLGIAGKALTGLQTLGSALAGIGADATTQAVINGVSGR